MSKSFDEFLKELTELSLKHKMVLCGDGVYYCIKAEETSENLKGKYSRLLDEPDTKFFRLEWSDDV